MVTYISGEKPTMTGRYSDDIPSLIDWCESLEKEHTKLVSLVDEILNALRTQPNSVKVASSEPVGSDDMLLALYQSTKAFHERFNHYPPDYNQAVRMLDEELRKFNFWIEVFKTRLKNSAYIEPSALNEAILKFADIIVTIMGIFQSMDTDYGLIRDQVIKTIEKNNAKTDQTHFVDKTGKVTKRNK